MNANDHEPHVLVLIPVNAHDLDSLDEPWRGLSRSILRAGNAARDGDPDLGKSAIPSTSPPGSTPASPCPIAPPPTSTATVPSTSRPRMTSPT